MQNDFVMSEGVLCVSRAMATIPTIQRLAMYGRSQGWTILYVIRRHKADGSDCEAFRHHLFDEGNGYCVEDSWGAQIVAPLTPTATDRMVVKRRFSGFDGTCLNHILKHSHILRVVIAGTQYPNCIRATAIDAKNLGYETVVCTDACSAQTEAIEEECIREFTAREILCVNSSELCQQNDK